VVQPRLGDFAFSWRDRWRTLWLLRRVRACSQEQRDEVVAAGHLVRKYWKVITDQGSTTTP
jgi:hypothetical protein